MKLQILATFDAAVGAYHQPFFSQSVAAGVRAFGDAVRDPQQGLFQHADDYKLYHIGVFDPESGEIEPCRPPSFVVNASSLKVTT